MDCKLKAGNGNLRGEAWNQFCTEKRSIIEKSFIDVGLSIASDGSEDSKLSIKGYEHGKPEIGGCNTSSM